MPSTPALPSPLPWSPAEVNALTQLGVQLRDPARELVSLALKWLRPTIASGELLIRDPKLFESLQGIHDKAVVAEMEA